MNNIETFIQALVVSFREGLEAFLIIVILLKFLDKTNNRVLKKNVWHGTIAGILLSVVFGSILFILSSFTGGTDPTAKLWESVASFIAVLLITTFIIWMIKHGSKIKHHIEKKARLNLSRKGIFLLALFMVAREGAEIAIFSFAGKYSVVPIFIGIGLSIAVVLLIHYSLIKVKLNTIFTITLIYLILQAGFLLGYSVHEGLSASKDLGYIGSSSQIFSRPFDLSRTPLNHKEGIIGLPLYIAVGWYSKPEWIQFILQYIYTLILIGYWFKTHKRV